jgi:hypothetical protein
MKFSFFSLLERLGVRWRWTLPCFVVLAIGIVAWHAYDNRSPQMLSGETRNLVLNWKLVFEAEHAPAATHIEDPETQLRLVYNSLGEGQRERALEQAEHLTLALPNFQLGHLIYADLLNISAEQPQNESLLIPEQAGMRDRLQDLVLEAKRRLTHPSFTQVQGKKTGATVDVGQKAPLSGGGRRQYLTSLLVCQQVAGRWANSTGTA